jgi:hypothetical protein
MVVWRITSCGDDTGPLLWAVDEEHGDNATETHAEG